MIRPDEAQDQVSRFDIQESEDSSQERVADKGIDTRRNDGKKGEENKKNTYHPVRQDL